MKVHQAYFGDREGSHNLIASSIEQKTLIGFLKLNTDIPASISINKPYLSASKVDGFYVLTKTMNDAESERPGMGFSHCIIIPINELEQVDNLQDVIDLFAGSPIKNQASLSDLELTPTPFILDTVSPTYNNLVEKLVSSTRTVIYLGYEHFENDIVRLWNILSKELRENLSFTISGSPNEIENENFTLVHSPESLAVRWSKYGLVKNQTEHSNNSGQNTFLIDPNNPESFEFCKFIKDNSIRLEFFHQYPAIEKLFRLSNQAIANPKPVLLKRVINLIGTIIPNAQEGKILKKKILELFVTCINSNETTDILLLRNMKFEAFDEARTKIAILMTSWADKFIEPLNTYFFPTGIKLMREVFSTSNPDWWKNELKKKFDVICCKQNKVSLSFIWSLWSKSPDLIPYSLIPPENEQLLLEQKTRNSDITFYTNLSRYCLEHKWYAMYAESISFELKNNDAINAQIAFDKSSKLEEHLGIIRDNITDKAFFTESLNIDNDTVHKIAGKIAADTPFLLNEIKTTNLNSQKIWHQSFLITKDITKGIKDSKKAMFEILDLIKNGQSFVQPLLTALAAADNNLFFYTSRKEIWNNLPDSISSIFLDGTAKYVVENFDTVSWDDLETKLIVAIRMDSFVQLNIIKNTRISIKIKIGILEKIQKLNDDNLVSILETANNNINYLESDMLSNLIKKHSFSRTLYHIFDNRSKHDFFPNVVDACKSLLKRWDRLWLNSNSKHISLESIKNEVDNQRLETVFQVLAKLGINDPSVNRMKEEYVAGVKGIDLIDLCNRLKTYLDSL